MNISLMEIMINCANFQWREWRKYGCAKISKFTILCDNTIRGVEVGEKKARKL